MAILQYVGDRPYVEFKVGQTTFGFARGTERSDVPKELLERFKGDNFPQWKVIGGEEKKSEEKTKKMVDWMKSQGETVSKSDTKAILTERAHALTSKGDE